MGTETAVLEDAARVMYAAIGAVFAKHDAAASAAGIPAPCQACMLRRLARDMLATSLASDAFAAAAVPGAPTSREINAVMTRESVMLSRAVCLAMEIAAADLEAEAALADEGGPPSAPGGSHVHH